MKTGISVVAALLFVTGVCVGVPAARAQGTCTGDCADDGEVTEADIEVGIHMIFDASLATECPAYGPVLPPPVSQIQRAIQNRADMCSGAPTATPTLGGIPATPTATASATPTPTSPAPPTPTGVPIAVAGRTTILVNTLGAIPNIVAAIISGLEFGGSSLVAGGGGGAGACPLGGTATRTGNIPFVSITLSNCKVSTADGSVSFNGTASINLTSFNINVTAVFADQMGTTTRTATAMIGGTVSPTFGGACQFTAASLTVANGTLSVETPEGVEVGVTFQNTSVVFDQIVFNGDCVPETYRMRFNGNAALLTPDGEPSPVTFDDFTMQVDDSGNPTLIGLSGDMSSACFGGSVSVTTRTQLAVPSGDICPTAGVLEVTGTSGMSQITYASDQSVTIDMGGEQQMFPSCLDPRLLMCLA